MKVEVLDIEKIGERAYSEVYRVLTTVDNPTLGLATGTSPISLYKHMIQGCKGGVSYKHVSTYNLDEYVGIGESNVNSYRYFMNNNLFDHIDIDKANTHVPCGVGNLQQQCDNYNAMLNGANIDLQILGIGNNGHIAFNEPYTPWDSITHIVELSTSTIDANARLFDNKADVPRQAITMGLANIMKAESIVVIATGLAKAQAVYDMVKGKVDTSCPASILQKHSNVLVLCDKLSASLL